jgi:hypothetical protein
MLRNQGNSDASEFNSRATSNEYERSELGAVREPGSECRIAITGGTGGIYEDNATGQNAVANARSESSVRPGNKTISRR